MSNDEGEVDPVLLRLATREVLKSIRADADACIQEAIEVVEKAASAKIEASVAAHEQKAADMLQELEGLKDSARLEVEAAAAAAADAAQAKASSEEAEQAAGEARVSAMQHATLAKTALDSSVQHDATVASIAKRVDTVNAQLKRVGEIAVTASGDYESHEKAWTTKFEEMFIKVENLLPGAASAGLAEGYRAEQISYMDGRRRANWAFIVSLGVLILALAFAPLKAWFGGGEGETDAQGFFLRAAFNLPIVVPAVWAAWTFHRRAATYDRLSEEYRHKMSVAQSFIGFTRQLQQAADREVGERTAESGGVADVRKQGKSSSSVLVSYMEAALAEICRPSSTAYERKEASSPAEDLAEKVLAGLRSAMQSKADK